MMLYWVTTLDHDEDWFIFANDAESAARYHEDEEGYDIGDAHACFVCKVPDEMTVAKGWPELKELESMGAKILRDSSPRKVAINDKIYTEGGLDAMIHATTTPVSGSIH